MGIAASMEKENAEKENFDVASINAVKTSLMGPLAGIGDSIFWGVWRVISAGIAVGLATSGNVLAPLVFLALFNIPQWLTRYYGAFLGYSLGSKYIERLYSEGLIGILTKGASMVGLMMVGAMTSSMVVFQTKLSFDMQGETVMKLQEMLDQIFVGIVPILLTLLCYYLLKKKVSITMLMLGIIVLGIIISALGIA
jgi:PTS system mannose-specific IID component